MASVRLTDCRSCRQISTRLVKIYACQADKRARDRVIEGMDHADHQTEGVMHAMQWNQVESSFSVRHIEAFAESYANQWKCRETPISLAQTPTLNHCIPKSCRRARLHHVAGRNICQTHRKAAVAVRQLSFRYHFFVVGIGN